MTGKKNFIDFLIKKEGLHQERVAFNARIDKELISRARLILSHLNTSLGSNAHLSIIMENLLRDFIETYKNDFQKIISEERQKIMKL